MKSNVYSAKESKESPLGAASVGSNSDSTFACNVGSLTTKIKDNTTVIYVEFAGPVEEIISITALDAICASPRAYETPTDASKKARGRIVRFVWKICIPL